MEEKKTRGFLFSKGMKVWNVLVFLAAVALFSVSAYVVSGLLSNGMDPRHIFEEDQVHYEDTVQCGAEISSEIVSQGNNLYNARPFLTDGKLDPEKKVDITNLEGNEKKKNKNTVYTVEDLKKLRENGSIALLEEAVYTVESGYYDLGKDTYYGSELLDENGMVTESEDKAALEVSEEGDFSPQFQYLYEHHKEIETVLPQSGVALAEYARKNPENVSLLDLYHSLIDTVDTLHWAADEVIADKSNIMYVMEDLDTGEVFTNVPEWKEGYKEGAVKDIPKQLWVQMERSKGEIKEAIMFNESPAEDLIYQHLKENTMLSDNERITVMLNVNYPVHDWIYEKSNFYETYKGWAEISVLGAGFSMLLGLLAVISLTIQAGRVRADRKLHLTRGDRIPTEVVLGSGIILGGLLIVCAAFGVEQAIQGGSVYYAVLISIGVTALAGVLLAIYMSLVRRLKGHVFWKNSLSYVIVKSCKSVYLARKTSSRMIIAFIGLVLGNMLVIAAFGGFGVLLALLGDGLVLLYLIRESAGRQVIRDGLARIASGELDFKIDERELVGDNREMAEAVNHVGDGLMNAVKETLKSERLKADLITNVSHDIKTPLTSIINYVDLLKRENIQDPRIKGYIEILDSKSQRLKQLTEDLVEASKISSGNITLDMHPIRFGELVWQTNGEFEEKFAAKGLEVVCEIPEEPVYVLADGRRMWRVVENLYNNVAKYAMPNTRVYVSVKQFGCRVVFDIKNISERPLNIDAEELTERFIRGDVSRSTEGSGLGLSIAKNLVILQGGTFDIYLDGDLFKVTITFEKATPETETDQ